MNVKCTFLVETFKGIWNVITKAKVNMTTNTFKGMNFLLSQMRSGPHGLIFIISIREFNVSWRLKWVTWKPLWRYKVRVSMHRKPPWQVNDVFGGHMSFFGGHWYPCFGFLVTSPLGFKAEVGCLIRIAEANLMYVPQDPPLVLHLLTSWWPAHSQSCPHILLQRWGCRDSNSCSQNICETDALPTELNRDQQVNNVTECLISTDHGGHLTNKIRVPQMEILLASWSPFLHRNECASLGINVVASIKPCLNLN